MSLDPVGANGLERLAGSRHARLWSVGGVEASSAVQELKDVHPAPLRRGRSFWGS
jgi:hypothetical protein